MKPSEVRSRILSEHVELRAMLDEIDGLVGRFESEPELAAPLREKGLALYARLAAHLDLEDEILAPALRQGDASGPRRAERLSHEHHEQRELLKYLVGRLAENARPTLLMVRELRNFAQLLREDMKHEESTLLSERALHDGSGPAGGGRG